MTRDDYIYHETQKFELKILAMVAKASRVITPAMLNIVLATFDDLIKSRCC